MPPGQGRNFSTDTIEKIKQLLATTELSISAVAERMGCSKSAVATINNKHNIRIYGKRRGKWTVNKDFLRKS